MGELCEREVVEIKMYKGIRLIKRLVALFLVLLLSIESFAAVVTDNDGSAFITKAEFDSLKTEFQAQIDQYNTSIDRKIDGTIASYLAGINVARTSQQEPLVTNYNLMRWQPNFKLYGIYKKWTSMTTKTEITSNSWFTPNLAEQRNITRGNEFIVNDYWGGDGGVGFGVYLRVTINTWNNGLANGRRDYMGSSGHPQTCPVLTTFLTESDGKWYVNKPGTNMFRNMFVMMNALYPNPHGDNLQRTQGTKELWQFTTNPVIFSDTTKLIFNPIEGSQVLNYDITFTATNDSNPTTFRSKIVSESAVWLTVQIYNTASSDSGYVASSSPVWSGDASHVSSDWFSRGSTWHYIKNMSACEKSLYYMAIGTDYDAPLNVVMKKKLLMDWALMLLVQQIKVIWVGNCLMLIYIMLKVIIQVHKLILTLVLVFLILEFLIIQQKT